MTQEVTPQSAAPRSINVHVPAGAKPKEYETIYILRSDVDADTADRVQARVAEVVDRGQGKLVKVEAWGRRRLAYPVAKQRRGVYVYVKYVGAGGLVGELERNLKLADAVLKYQTVTVREQVDLASLQIDPEEVKLARLELPVEEEKEESREKILGLIEAAEAPPRARREDEGDEFADEEMMPSSEGEPAAAAAPAAPAAPAATPEKKDEE
ncbi:MAG TPA: 30S ribosomal protein S6 [Polyangiaceae bacterium]|jgi:small subunit ribosomal protein S6